MAFLVNIGSGGTNYRNKSGVGSRGYHIFQRDTTVVCRWAGVAVSSKREFTWTRKPREQMFTHRTRKAASAYLAKRIHTMTQSGAGYRELQPGVRITGYEGGAARAKPVAKPISQSHTPTGIARAISIRQPLVEQILRGEKKWECRSQPTVLRQRVYLYASLKPFDDDSLWKKVGRRPGSLPTGCIVGTVEITDCVKLDDGEFKYKLASPKRLRRALFPKNQPQPRFWIPKF
jgi:hypothetical protein